MSTTDDYTRKELAHLTNVRLTVAQLRSLTAIATARLGADAKSLPKRPEAMRNRDFHSLGAEMELAAYLGRASRRAPDDRDAEVVITLGVRSLLRLVEMIGHRIGDEENRIARRPPYIPPPGKQHSGLATIARLSTLRDLLDDALDRADDELDNLTGAEQ